MAKVVRRPGSEKWQCEYWAYIGGKRCRRYKSTGIVDDGSRQSRQTAEAIAAKIERDSAHGSDVARKNTKTLGQAFLALIQAAELAERSKHTLENIYYRGKSLKEHFGANQQLGDIDMDALRKFCTWSRSQPTYMGTARSAYTVQRELVTLFQAFKVVGLEASWPGWPDLGPTAREHKPQRVLELDEQRRLLMAIPPKRRLNVLAYLQMGLRASEPWKIVRVDWEARLAYVQGTKRVKDRKGPRIVPIPDELFELLVQRKNETPLFPKWHQHSLDYAIKRAGRRTGLCDNLSVNDLRGTYATFMARGGANPIVLAGYLGNSVQMLESTYAQVNIAGDHMRQDAARGVPRLTAAKAVVTDTYTAPTAIAGKTARPVQ